MWVRKHWIPFAIAILGSLAGVYLSRQDVAVKVTDQGVPVQPPPTVTSPPKATVGGRTGQPIPAGVFRSLNKINAAAKAVGCDELRPNDPAGRLIDVAECLGAKAVARWQK